jgi:hypothetical protein
MGSLNYLLKLRFDKNIIMKHLSANVAKMYVHNWEHIYNYNVSLKYDEDVKFRISPMKQTTILNVSEYNYFVFDIACNYST